VLYCPQQRIATEWADGIGPACLFSFGPLFAKGIGCMIDRI